jgi:type II secretory ATPase GspE/PulE/Tfp pilus assembly ATPase PilB-like protein
VLASVLGGEAAASLDAECVGSLWDNVVARDLFSEKELVVEVATHFHIPVADLSRVSAQALELVPERWARHFTVLPLALENEELVIASANPCNVDCERALAFAAGRAVRFAMASPPAIARRIDEVYGHAGETLEEAPSPMESDRQVDVQLLTADHESCDDGVDIGDDGPSISRLVDELLGAGISARASDIHIETEEQGIVVRHRVDGVIRVARRLPRSLASALASRVKIISGLDIADRLRPQDGRARVAVNGAAVDLRVSTLPASHGENSRVDWIRA